MSEPLPKIRIVIVDDQHLFASLLKTMLETRSDDFEVVGMAKEGRAALDVIDGVRPDLVLLDVKMPGMDGVRTAKELVKRAWCPKIIMLTTFDDNRAVLEVLGAGVSGYILKDCAPEELFAAIKAVHAGSTSFSAPIVKYLLQGAESPVPPPAVLLPEKDLSAALNRREKEILLLIAEGLENAEIAAQLYIAEQTVKNNISSIYNKLDIKDRSKLVKVAEAFAGSRPAKDG